MPRFRITVVNHDFESSSEQDLSDLAAAKAVALKGAIEVGAEQVIGGSPLFGAEVTVSDGNVRERFIVSIAASPLK